MTSSRYIISLSLYVMSVMSKMPATLQCSRIATDQKSGYQVETERASPGNGALFDVNIHEMSLSDVMLRSCSFSFQVLTSWHSLTMQHMEYKYFISYHVSKSCVRACVASITTYWRLTFISASNVKNFMLLFSLDTQLHHNADSFACLKM